MNRVLGRGNWHIQGGHLNHLVWWLMVFTSALFLGSCVTPSLDQSLLRAFPLVGLGAGLMLEKPGVSSAATGDAAFPDLYLFADRAQSPVLFKKLADRVFQLAQQKNPQFAGLDRSMLDQVNQILVFRPARQNGYQGILVGAFSSGLLRAGLASQKLWRPHQVTTGVAPDVAAFDCPSQNVHLGLLGTRFIAFQIDDPQPEQNIANGDAFDSLLSRLHVLNLRNSKLAARDMGLISTEERSMVLLADLDPAVVFVHGSIKPPATIPVRAIRFGVEPQADKPERFVVSFSLLPPEGVTTRMLRLGIKLALLGFANVAGLDAAFLGKLELGEHNGVVTMVGRDFSESSMTTLIDELMKMGLDSGLNDGQSTEISGGSR